MTGWLIAGGIVLLIVLLLLSPVRAAVIYDGDLTVTVRFLFLRFALLTPEQEPQPPAAAQKAGRAAKTHTPALIRKARELEQTLQETLDTDSLPETLSRLTALITDVLHAGSRLLSKATLTRLRLDLAVGGADAAATALRYGLYCSAVYPLVGVITGAFRRFRRPDMRLTCAYGQADTVFAGDCRLRAPLFTVLYAGLRFAFAQARRRSEEAIV